MKKLLCSILLSLITCFSLVSCGSGAGNGTSGGNTDSTVKVPAKGVTVNQNNVIIEESTSINVFANVVDGYTGDYTFTWTSTDPTIAQAQPVSSKQTMTGRIIGKKAGTTKVVVTEAGGKFAEITVTVEPYTVATASLVALTVGETEAFPITPSTAGITFSSQNEKVATVAADGTITAHTAGRTRLTARKNSVAKTINVDLQVNKADIINLVIGETGKDSAVLPMSGATYVSQNPAVATVDANGTVTAVADGEMQVVATKDGKAYAYDVAVIGTKAQTIAFGEQVDAKVSVYGRTSYKENKGRMFYFAPAGFDVTFFGTQLTADMYSEITDGHYSWLSVYVDGESMTEASTTGDRIVKLETSGEKTIVSGLQEGWHTVKVRKRTPYISGDYIWDAYGVKSLTTDGYFGYANNKSNFRIDVYGDSISCGYGNLTDGETNTASTSDGVMAWESLLAHEIGADLNVAAASGWGIAYDASGDIKNSKEWNLWTKDNAYDKLTPYENGTSGYSVGADLVLINLGTNDHTGLNAGGDANYVSKKLMYWLFTLKASNPQTPIVSMYGMMGVDSKTRTSLENAVNAVQKTIEALNAAKASGKTKDEAITEALTVVDKHVKINDATEQVTTYVTGVADLIFAEEPTAVTANVYYLSNKPVNGVGGHPLVDGHKQATQEVLQFLVKNNLLGAMD